MSASNDPRPIASSMVRIDLESTSWLEVLGLEDRWEAAPGPDHVEDVFSWLNDATDLDGPMAEALPNILGPLEAADHGWIARWGEFEDSLEDGDQADEG